MDAALALPLAAVRLDVWLDVSCLFKTRSAAQQACRGGKIEVNDEAAKPHKLVRPGDAIRISRGGGRRQLVLVLGLAEHSLAKAEARKLYQDRTPAPTPDELEIRAFERAYPRPKVAPSRRDQRLLRKLKQQPE
jgi:ribosome-associated heat shock protein Hsp15